MDKMKELQHDSAYARLIRDITALHAQARLALVVAYWEIGKRIVEEEREAQGRAAYGTQLITRLSRDLQKKLGNGFSERNLHNMRRFCLLNPNPQTSADLTWSQHVELMPIKNPSARRKLEQRIVKQNPSIVIQTHKYDKYTRYLTDLFYLPGSTNPEVIIEKRIHLNQQLLDKGLAEVWKDR
jgi:hypothetical protein